MKQAHHITLSVFIHEGENEEKTVKAIHKFLPDNFEDEKIHIKKEEAKIIEGQDMTLFSVQLSKQKHIKQVIEKLKDLLGKKQYETISSQENRVDEEGNMFLRIDKKKFEDERKAILTDKGNCFHFKIVLAAFPKNQENAISVMKELFEKK